MNGAAIQPVSYLYAARATRAFGDGFAVIILPAYLSAIGFDAVAIGLIATASLFGSALTTLAVGYLAVRYDLRNLLIAGAMLMLATGLPYPTSFLSLAPAAVTEMVVTAQVMHLEAEVVTAFHVMRIAVVSSTVLIVFKFYLRLRGGSIGPGV